MNDFRSPFNVNDGRHVPVPKNGAARKTAETKDTTLLEWNELPRGAPTVLLRSALFAAIQGKCRRTIQDETLCSQSGPSLRFAGAQLDQADLDVWAQAIHLARFYGLNNIRGFRASAFLKAIGRNNGKAQYRWLNESFKRLVSCRLEILDQGESFSGALLSQCSRDEESGVYQLAINPEIIQFFVEREWTVVDWGQRRKLIGKPLALWLHGFYSGQAEIQPVRVESLLKLSGSTNRSECDFKRKLKSAFAVLHKTVGLAGFIEGGWVQAKRRRPTAGYMVYFAEKTLSEGKSGSRGD